MVILLTQLELSFYTQPAGARCHRPGKCGGQYFRADTFPATDAAGRRYCLSAI